MTSSLRAAMGVVVSVLYKYSTTGECYLSSAITRFNAQVEEQSQELYRVSFSIALAAQC